MPVLVVLPRLLDVTGTPNPQTWDRQPIESLEGKSLASVFKRDSLERPPMLWEHEGNAAVRIGKWKVVRNYPA